MIKLSCDKCGKDLPDNIDCGGEGTLKITAGIEWNSSWEEYGQFVFCGDCVGNDKTLLWIQEKLK